MVFDFPADILPDLMSDTPFPSFDETGFMFWPFPDTSLILEPQQLPQPVISTSSGSDDQSTMNHVVSPISISSVSNSSYEMKPGTSMPSSITDECRKRRMISNRESARRSRMRKQKHMENLRNQVDLLRTENRELANQLRFVVYHFRMLRTNNERLMSEHFVLLQKLATYSKLMMLLQQQQHQYFPATWPNNALISSQQLPSLMT